MACEMGFDYYQFFRNTRKYILCFTVANLVRLNLFKKNLTGAGRVRMGYFKLSCTSAGKQPKLVLCWARVDQLLACIKLYSRSASIIW